MLSPWSTNICTNQPITDLVKTYHEITDVVINVMTDNIEPSSFDFIISCFFFAMHEDKNQSLSDLKVTLWVWQLVLINPRTFTNNTVTVWQVCSLPILSLHPMLTLKLIYTGFPCSPVRHVRKRNIDRFPQSLNSRLLEYSCYVKY